VARALGLRRYGFHGLSHAWVARRAPELLGARAGLRIVSCHLGAGASLCAIADGRSIDTTMGFTPLEGLVMATRSGSVDPGLLLWLLEREELSPGASSPTRSSTARACSAWPAAPTCADGDGGAHAGRARVVFGDIGTSPLYAVQAVFTVQRARVHVTQADVYGVISLVFWSITMIVSVKYVSFIMRADNGGEGGIMALTALIQGAKAQAQPRRWC
jgi:hypothetical protein